MADLRQIECNVCKQPGGIKPKKVSRFSTPVVVIGWIIVLPSVLGIMGGGCMLIATGSATEKTTAGISQEYHGQLEKIQGITPEQLEGVKALTNPTKQQLEGLGLKQKQIAAVNAAHNTVTAGQAGAAIGAGCAGGASVFMMIASLVGGLLGYLLIMKRKVLYCTKCSGIHSEAL